MTKFTALLGAVSAAALSTAIAGEIDGQVTDAAGTVPLRGAEVTLAETGRTVATDRNGGFRFAGLPAGDYTLVVSYAGSGTDTVANVTLPSADAAETVEIAMAESDVVVVEGQVGQLNSALAQQRSADGIVTILSADSIGQLPDENVAEAARRALGVSIANDQGEGRFITIRGINSGLNATSVNGVRLTSPEAGDRRIGLDVIDADVLKNIVINKTLSADMDGDAIGGSVNLETISGLDQEDMLAKFKVGTIYTEATEDWGSKVSGTYANNYMDGRFGVALSGSYQNREFANENKEVDGDWVTDEALAFPEEQLELRDYEVERERLSLAANFDFMATENTKLYLHSLYNDFSDQEYRNRVQLTIEDATPSFDTANNLVTFDTNGEKIEVEHDIKDRLEEQRIWSVTSGFEHFAGLWTLDGSISFTHAEEEEPGRIDTNFVQEFEGATDSIGLDVSNRILPRIVFTDPGVQAGYLDASGFELDELETVDGIAEDDELAITLNVKRDLQFGQYPGFVQFGAKSRMREKEYDLDFSVFGYEAGVATLADFETTVDYPLDVFGPAANPFAVREFFNANRNDVSVFERKDEESDAESAFASYNAEEDVLAGYVMGQVDINSLRLTGGVRVERTETETTGNAANDDTGTIAPVTFENDYTDVLPSIAARWEVQENVIVRASYYASIIRPNFQQSSPSALINDDGELEAGNPNLERTEADNFDLLVEYYPSASAVIQGGIFFKDLKNLIAESGDAIPGLYPEPGTVGGLPYDEVDSVFINLDDAEIFGVEFGYQQSLDFLPAPWDGTIVGLNYTYADSEATFDGETVELPGQSEHIFNAILGYEKGPMSLRAAYSYKGENVDDVDVFGDGDGRVVLDQQFLDISAKYDVTDEIKVYFDVKNVLDTELEIVQRYDEGDFLSQYEEYGRRFEAGLRFKF